MSTDAAARAKARREAILAKRTDRLSKLTTSARGEDAAYLHDDPPLPTLTNFLGEDTPPPVSRRSVPPEAAPTQAAPFGQLDAIPGLPPGFEQFMSGREGSPMPDWTRLLGPQVEGAPEPTPAPVLVAQRTLLQHVLPIVHLLLMLGAVTYYTWISPPHGESWAAWRDLVRRRPTTGDLPALPSGFFWTFLSLEVGLHSLRFFTRSDTVTFPWIVNMALPHLPQPLPGLIVNGAKYYAMVGMLLDDIAALVFAVGLVTWYASLWSG